MLSYLGLSTKEGVWPAIRSARERYFFDFLARWFSPFIDTGNSFSFDFCNRGISLFYWPEQRRMILLAIYSQFVAEQYGMLNVQGKRVLDVGASVGDTATYFSARNALEVIALEPFRATFSLAQASLIHSHVGNVTLVNEGLGSADIRLDPELRADPSTKAENLDGGVAVRFSELEELIERFDLRDAVLKVDCEGGETSLLSTPAKLLRRSPQGVAKKREVRTCPTGTPTGPGACH